MMLIHTGEILGMVSPTRTNADTADLCARSICEVDPI